MLDAGIFVVAVLAAGGVAAAMSQQWRHHRQPSPSGTLPATATENGGYLLATGGRYRTGTPGSTARLQTLDHLEAVGHGLLVYPSGDKPLTIRFQQIQWVSTVNIVDEKYVAIIIHFEQQKRWWMLELQLDQTEMMVLINVMRRSIPLSRLNLGNLPHPPVGPVAARIARENWQGSITAGAEVTLYLLPNLLVILSGDHVHARLATGSIRRVLSVERESGKLDNLLQWNSNEGLIRLYSLHETAAFLLPHYRELAEEIALAAHCPLEHITREDKTNKV